MFYDANIKKDYKHFVTINKIIKTLLKIGIQFLVTVLLLSEDIVTTWLSYPQKTNKPPGVQSLGTSTRNQVCIDSTK
jgi:hypothetical protein